MKHHDQGRSVTARPSTPAKSRASLRARSHRSPRRRSRPPPGRERRAHDRAARRTPRGARSERWCTRGSRGGALCAGPAEVQALASAVGRLIGATEAEMHAAAPAVQAALEHRCSEAAGTRKRRAECRAKHRSPSACQTARSSRAWSISRSAARMCGGSWWTSRRISSSR